LALALSLVAPTAAASPPDVVFEAGQVCAFAVGMSETMVGPRIQHVRTDADGNVIREMVTGRGGNGTFQNMDTGATYSFPAYAPGSNLAAFPRADGSMRLVATGGWALFMFPTDIPPGPSLTVVLGRMVIDVSATGVFTLVSITGRQVDVCAALS
jgi:hypothetical protein